MRLRRQSISTHTPLARRDCVRASDCSYAAYFNSHASCEARLKGWEVLKFKPHISTHTPLARRDRRIPMLYRTVQLFNSHASCEARLGQWYRHYIELKFQLTRLLRGATHIKPLQTWWANFNSHASCEARLSFYIAAFQQPLISTHTPLARRDLDEKTLTVRQNHFNSHASCEARLTPRLKSAQKIYQFQLTRLLRGATLYIVL